MILFACRPQLAAIANSATSETDEPVAERYRRLLHCVGRLVVVDTEADICAQVLDAYARGEQCIYLAFCVPNQLPVDFPCPVIPVFGWPYSSLPNETWAANVRNNWPEVLLDVPSALTFSSHTAAVTREAMNEALDVAVLPMPVFDEYNGIVDTDKPRNSRRQQVVEYTGPYIDTEKINFADEKSDVIRETLESQGPEAGSIQLQGLVYTAVIEPLEELENWDDLLWAYCWAFREMKNTTLVMLLKQTDNRLLAFSRLLNTLYHLEPFSCRVIVLCGPLPAQEYQKLIVGSTYIVSSTAAEAQCLPAMEFMSAGVPAIAPDHTAFSDYIDEQAAFVAESSVEWVAWPQDPRYVRRTFCYRINWASLERCFKESYRVAEDEPARYQAMSQAAVEQQRDHCSIVALETRVGEFFRSPLLAEAMNAAQRSHRPEPEVSAGFVGQIARRLRRKLGSLLRNRH